MLNACSTHINNSSEYVHLNIKCTHAFNGNFPDTPGLVRHSKSGLCPGANIICGAQMYNGYRYPPVVSGGKAPGQQVRGIKLKVF